MAQLIIWNTFEFARHTVVRPLGPHQLANYLKSKGYTVKVIDFSSLMSTNDLIMLTKKHIDQSTIAIGVSNTFWDEIQAKTIEPDWVLRARGFLENLFPNIVWLLGGSRNSYLKLELKKKWELFTGYSEDSLLKFLDFKTKNTKFRKNFDIENNTGHFCNNLSIKPYEVLPIELSRGCQFKCRFCRFAELGKKKNTYIRNYQLIENELISNYENYGTTRYMVMDDTANESTEKLEALANIAQRLPFKLEWVGYVRLDLIGAKPHTAQLLVDSGLVGSFFGIESFHPEASKIVGKNWNGKHGKDFLLKLKDEWKDKVVFEVGLIAGLNQESLDDLYATHQWCIDNEIYSWRFTPLSISRQPTQLWKSEFDLEYEKYGYRFLNNEMYNWESDYWTYKEAQAVAEALNEDAKNYVYTNTWHAATICSLGYDFSELFKVKTKELSYEEFKNKTQQFVKNYVEEQKKMPV